MQVPFLDLKSQYRPIQQDIQSEIQRVLENTAFSGGPFVEHFEQQFADFCNSKYAIGVGNGTDALWLSLIALGIGPGDEVITVPNSFIATAEAITLCGAKPVFVDIDPQTYNMNPLLLEDALTPRTKAIIPVHLFGQPADMDQILDIARRNKLYIIEDACQAHGAEYRGVKAGSMGDAGCFSFYPGKNLGAYGEAGAIVTNSDLVASMARMFRDHGQERKYRHKIIGWNARMDGIQGAILSVKLKQLARWNEARRDHAREYSKLLNFSAEIITPHEADYAKHVFHIYAVRVKKRDQIMAYLSDHGISCGIHYPLPIHLQAAYEHMGHKTESYPVAERCSQEFLSLPMYPELTSEQIHYVAERIREFHE